MSCMCAHVSRFGSRASRRHLGPVLRHRPRLHSDTCFCGEARRHKNSTTSCDQCMLCQCFCLWNTFHKVTCSYAGSHSEHFKNSRAFMVFSSCAVVSGWTTQPGKSRVARGFATSRDEVFARAVSADGFSHSRACAGLSQGIDRGAWNCGACVAYLVPLSQ